MQLVSFEFLLPFFTCSLDNTKHVAPPSAAATTVKIAPPVPPPLLPAASATPALALAVKFAMKTLKMPSRPCRFSSVEYFSGNLLMLLLPLLMPLLASSE